MKVYWITRSRAGLEGGVIIYRDRGTSWCSPLFAIDLSRRDAAKILRKAHTDSEYSVRLER